MEIVQMIPTYTGTYLIRVGTFYWLPSIVNPHNRYKYTSVRGIKKFDTFTVEVDNESEKDIFQALGLYPDQVITSIELIALVE